MESMRPFSRRVFLKTIGPVSLFGTVTHAPLAIADVVKGGLPAVKRNPVQFKQLLDDMDALDENFGFYSKSFNR